MCRYILTLLAALSPYFTSATHLVGGSMTYEHISDSTYLITLTMYRDCSPANTNNANFDQQVNIGIFELDSLYTTLQIQNRVITNVPAISNNPCIQVPSSICIEKAVYQDFVILPPSVFGYTITHHRCCRTPSVVNIVNSQGNLSGSTYTTTIPPLPFHINSSAEFQALPPLVVCVGYDFTFNHIAADPDGDSLSYALVDPLDMNFDGNTPAPPPFAPPYPPVVWKNGYSTSYQVDGNPGFTIDPITGQITGKPTQIGQYAFSVAVREYKNGILVNEVVRDFRLDVQFCQSNVVSAIQDQNLTQLCGGLTVDFINNSLNSNNYYWDFGDPNNPASTSNLSSPTYTYTDTGTYEVMLVATPGFFCADTSYAYFHVREPLTVDFQPPPDQCISQNSFDFNAQSNFANNSTITWDFGPDANPRYSSSHNPTNVVFADTGYHKVTVSAYDTCTAVHVDSIRVEPEPIARMDAENLVGCSPLVVSLTNLSFSQLPATYNWDFGNGNSSSLKNPDSVVYTSPGEYTISLTVSNDSICQISKTYEFPISIEVVESPIAGFEAEPTELSIFGNDTVYIADSSLHAQQVFYDFGDGEKVYPSEFAYRFREPGVHYIRQRVITEEGCEDITFRQVEVRGGAIFLPNAFSPNDDDINDIYYAKGVGVKTFNILIYNRWGELVAESETMESIWDGINPNTGKKMPQGVYPYVLKYTDLNDVFYKKTGSISLIY